MCKHGDLTEIELPHLDYSRLIDSCMVGMILELNNGLGKKTLACCCGHDVYPKTIIIEGVDSFGNKLVTELISGVEIPRTRKFYRMDKNGYYYIPELDG